MIFIGAENIISKVGQTANENFAAIKNGESCISKYENAGYDGSAVYLGKIDDQGAKRFYTLIKKSLTDAISQLDDPGLVTSDRTLWILSSTKGDLQSRLKEPFFSTISDIVSEFNLSNEPVCLSNACVSGVMAINLAAEYIKSKRFDHVVVTGCDVVSPFVTYGFQALFAMSDQPCRPFDEDRAGISLGEGAATVILSNSESIFQMRPCQYLGGSSTNDANHISGPSRTGEGLKRSIEKTLAQSKVDIHEIDHILAHGTATVYNDEMEAIAFNRIGAEQIPLNSLKGYYGHTLGAAGVIESVIGVQSIRNNLMIASAGFQNLGTSKPVAVLSQNKEQNVETILKTSSGFGGCNSTLVIREL